MQSNLCSVRSTAKSNNANNLLKQKSPTLASRAFSNLEASDTTQNDLEFVEDPQWGLDFRLLRR